MKLIGLLSSGEGVGWISMCIECDCKNVIYVPAMEGAKSICDKCEREIVVRSVIPFEAEVR